ncbi:MAG: helix-turn-helix transcriptional regulator [Terricaulis sp.]
MSDERSANAVDRRLGLRVRSRRLEIGMSQETLAKLLGVTFQQVQKYEKGVNRIAASRLFDIAAALDMPVARFFEGLGPATSIENAEDVAVRGLATPEGAQLMALFASIDDPKVRRRLIKLAQALVDDAG